MNKVLIFLLTFYGAFVFAEEHKVCEIKIKRKSLDGIEVCKQDDVLIIYAGLSQKLETVAKGVTTICKHETIKTIGNYIPNHVIHK